MSERSRRLPQGLVLPEPDPSKETLDHFERFCYTLPNPDTHDDHFRLQEWQYGPLEDFFAGGKEAEFFQHLWEWPTGLGKSTLFGAICLHHGTYVVKLPRVYIVGGELEHARNTLNAASSFVLEARKRGQALGFWWEPQEYLGGRLIPMWLDNLDVGIICRTAGRAKEASGGSSVEGKDPTLIVVEELHRHKDNGSAVSVLISKTVKAGARGATVKALIGTTAGTNRDSYLGRLESMVLDEEAGAVVQTDLRPGEYYTRAVDPDGETVAHIWAVPESISPPPLTVTSGDELDEYLSHVVRANPASWITERALKRVWKALGRLLRWQFLRQNANQWVTAGVGAIDRGQWWALKDPELRIPKGPGVRVVIGLDRGYKWATTAIVPVWKPPDGSPVRVAGAVILDPKKGGETRRTREVGEILETMLEAWPDALIAFDRAQGGGDVAEELEENHGITIVDHDQGKAFELASMKLGEYVENRKLVHDGNEAFSNQVLSAVAKFVAGGRRWRGEPPDAETSIDGFDALAMALNVATSPMGETRGKKNPASGDVDDYRIERL
jgi:phage terminase large subunit-like protein